MRAALLATISFAAACHDHGWHEGDPVDRAVTGWRLLPSLDEARVAVTLEPRKIHRDEQGVLVLGHETRLVGPSVVVENDVPFATLGVGATDVEVGATRAWVLQSTVDAWEHLFPSEAPPRAPVIRGTIVDRATFAMSPPVTFDPPIEIPLVVGDTLFDLPARGSSDIARDVVLRRRTDDGGAVVVHAGRGFGVATCTRGDGIAIAYKREDGALQLVAVRPDALGGWSMNEATFAGVQFDPRGAACSDGAAHVALVLPTGLSVFSIETATQIIDAAGTTPPAVLRPDGLAIVSVRASDRMLMFVDDTGATSLGEVSAKNPEMPQRTGNLAMFELESSLVVVDLATGTLGARVPALRTTMYPYEMIAWRDRFIVQQSSCCQAAYQDDRIENLLVVDRTTTTALPVPAASWSAELLVPAQDRLYLRTYDSADADGTPWLVTIDPAAQAILTEEPLPLCDETTVLEERGCR